MFITKIIFVFQKRKYDFINKKKNYYIIKGKTTFMILNFYFPYYVKE